MACGHNLLCSVYLPVLMFAGYLFSNYNQNRTSLTCSSSNWCSLVADYSAFCCKNRCFVVYSELVSQYSSHGSWSLHNGLNIHWWYVSNYNQNRTSLTCSSSNWCSLVADYGAFCCKNQCFVVYSELVSQYSSHGSWSLHNGLNIHWWYVLSPLCWNSNKSKHPRRVKNRRHKRPCTYYSNSTATFHLLLQGDLVFKLNPGPEEYQISSIVSSRLNTHQHMSTDRNRNLDNLSWLEICDNMADTHA